MTEKLKNCQCGGSVALNFGETTANIYCEKCGIIAPTFRCEKDFYRGEDAITKAIAAWNARQPRFSPEEREALETICRLSNLGMLQEYKNECFCDSKKFATINYTKHQKLRAIVQSMLQEGEK